MVAEICLSGLPVLQPSNSSGSEVTDVCSSRTVRFPPSATKSPISFSWKEPPFSSMALSTTLLDFLTTRAGVDSPRSAATFQVESSRRRPLAEGTKFSVTLQFNPSDSPKRPPMFIVSLSLKSWMFVSFKSSRSRSNTTVMVIALLGFPVHSSSIWLSGMGVRRGGGGGTVLVGGSMIWSGGDGDGEGSSLPGGGGGAGAGV
mmetsp:Transcript_24973/g.67904  ORF Transcript_24973/g.67904 Transcript_24973/m.67904 type:complete len:202 (+) Transcript_24973:1475-2080(+)